MPDSFKNHTIHQNPNFSYWEIQTFFQNSDLIIVGSGIVGLNAAIYYKKKHKTAKVILLERHILPHGASSKNAGFACFGSVSELLADIQAFGEKNVWQTVDMRIKGLELLRKNLGDSALDYQEHGGYELFDSSENMEYCMDAMSGINKSIKSITGYKHVFQIDNKGIKKFQFHQAKGMISNHKEGQLNPGKMLQSLVALATQQGVIILNSIGVTAIEDLGTKVLLQTSVGELVTKKVIVATNGFANQLLNMKDVKPARAQVLITKPIQGLKFKGTFHYDEGFYYFRNVGKRVLLGGGRNLDFEKETTSNFELNPKIQDHLDGLLRTLILPNTNFEVEHRWVGIMGIGESKQPIIKSVSGNVVCAVRMGGMGIAIGSLVGKRASQMIE